MLQQQREFAAWGLTKIAVRNIVVFFITSLIASVIVLYRANDKLQERLVSCEQEQAKKVGDLERLHIESVRELYEQMIERMDRHGQNGAQKTLGK